MKRMHPIKFDDYSERSKRRIKRKRRDVDSDSSDAGDVQYLTSESGREHEHHDELATTSQVGPIEDVNNPVETGSGDGNVTRKYSSSSSEIVRSSSEDDSASSSLSDTEDDAGRSDFEDDGETDDLENLEDIQPGAPAGGDGDGRHLVGGEDGRPPDDGDLPIYDGAPVTVAQSVLCIMSFFLSHQLTGSALGDLLDLINLHCVKPNRCLQSLYKFKKYFENYQFPIKKHYYCSVCFQKLESVNSVCPIDNAHKGTSYFVEIPVKDQLQCFMSRPGFYEMLNYRFERNKSNAENFEDIYDGECYKKFSCNGGLLSDRNNGV